MARRPESTSTDDSRSPVPSRNTTRRALDSDPLLEGGAPSTKHAHGVDDEAGLVAVGGHAVGARLEAAPGQVQRHGVTGAVTGLAATAWTTEPREVRRIRIEHRLGVSALERCRRLAPDATFHRQHCQQLHGLDGLGAHGSAPRSRAARPCASRASREPDSGAPALWVPGHDLADGAEQRACAIGERPRLWRHRAAREAKRSKVRTAAVRCRPRRGSRARRGMTAMSASSRRRGRSATALAR